MSKKIEKLMSFDALSEAQIITGESYKYDELTKGIGFHLFVDNNRKKEKALSEVGDSTFSMGWESYIECCKSFGYEEVYRESFDTEKGKDQEIIMFHAAGVLLYADSFWGNRNSSKIYLNWKPNKDNEDYYRMISSGHFTDDFWVGCHDTREGVGLITNRYLENGSFLNPWKEKPFIWLLNHEDSKIEGYDKDEINSLKISKLPEYVQECICVN